MLSMSGRRISRCTIIDFGTAIEPLAVNGKDILFQYDTYRSEDPKIVLRSGPLVVVG